jgi:hypothetical protein
MKKSSTPSSTTTLSREELELRKLDGECRTIELNNEMLRDKLHPQLFNADSFAKTIQFILAHATGLSTGLGSACFAIASGLYANGVTSKYCHDLSNQDLRGACNTGSAGVGFLVAGVGFFGISKLFNKLNTPTNDESSTKMQKLD